MMCSKGGLLVKAFFRVRKQKGAIHHMRKYLFSYPKDITARPQPKSRRTDNDSNKPNAPINKMKEIT